MIRSRRHKTRPTPSPSHRRSIASELEWGRRKLSRAGKSQPEKWALAIWATLSSENPGAVWLKRLDSPPSPDLVARYRRATSSYAAGAPFQSAVGLASFRTIQVAVSRDVLIPRVETEDLVTHVLSWAAEHSPGRSWGVAADIGTGTGAIAISLAVEGRFERIIATDLSSSALSVAGRNVTAIATGAPIELRQGSFLEPLGETVDVIVSNPPYLTSVECEELAPEVRDYEPRVALDGGSDGLDPYRILVSGAARRLAPGGLLALEIDSRRPDEILAMAMAAGWSDAQIVNDVFGRARYLLATNGKRTQ